MTGIFFNPFSWLVAAVVISFVELIAPGFVFLGLGIAAATIGLLLIPFGGWLEQWSLGWAAMLACYGLFSFLGWVVLRQLLGVHHSQVKIITEDINEINRGDS